VTGWAGEGWVAFDRSRAVVFRAALSAAQGASVPYITWSLPQQTLAGSAKDAVVEHDASQGESSGGEDAFMEDAGCGRGEEWDELLLDEDE
jgi:hypothetical protein